MLWVRAPPQQVPPATTRRDMYSAAGRARLCTTTRVPPADLDPGWPAATAILLLRRLGLALIAIGFVPALATGTSWAHNGLHWARNRSLFLLAHCTFNCLCLAGSPFFVLQFLQPDRA